MADSTTGADPKRELACSVDGCGKTFEQTTERAVRICSEHRFALSFELKGVAHRYCQQCSRPHTLSKFSGRRRGCEARLKRRRDRYKQQTIEVRRRLEAPRAWRPASATNDEKDASLLHLPTCGGGFGSTHDDVFNNTVNVGIDSLEAGQPLLRDLNDTMRNIGQPQSSFLTSGTCNAPMDTWTGTCNAPKDVLLGSNVSMQQAKEVGDLFSATTTLTGEDFEDDFVDAFDLEEMPYMVCDRSDSNSSTTSVVAFSDARAALMSEFQHELPPAEETLPKDYSRLQLAHQLMSGEVVPTEDNCARPVRMAVDAAWDRWWAGMGSSAAAGCAEEPKHYCY